MDNMNNMFSALPSSLSMSILMNERAKAGYDSLSEAEKEDLILRCKDAKTKAEMDKTINEVLGGPGIG